MLVCINVETRYKETEARMGDVTCEFSFLEKEGKERVTKSLILLWRFMAHLRYLI